MPRCNWLTSRSHTEFLCHSHCKSCDRCICEATLLQNGGLPWQSQGLLASKDTVSTVSLILSSLKGTFLPYSNSSPSSLWAEWWKSTILQLVHHKIGRLNMQYAHWRASCHLHHIGQEALLRPFSRELNSEKSLESLKYTRLTGYELVTFLVRWAMNKLVPSLVHEVNKLENPNFIIRRCKDKATWGHPQLHVDVRHGSLSNNRLEG